MSKKEINTHIYTVVFGQCPRKNPMQENRCRSWGFWLLCSSFWIQVPGWPNWLSDTKIKLNKKIVRRSHTITRKSSTDLTRDELLRCLCVVSVSAHAVTASLLLELCYTSWSLALWKLNPLASQSHTPTSGTRSRLFPSRISDSLWSSALPQHNSAMSLCGTVQPLWTSLCLLDLAISRLGKNSTGKISLPFTTRNQLDLSLATAALLSWEFDL